MKYVDVTQPEEDDGIIVLLRGAPDFGQFKFVVAAVNFTHLWFRSLLSLEWVFS